MAYKVSSSNSALANTKNRSQTSQLEAYLDKIEKEKQNELRMDNNEKLRFRAKYSKLSMSTDGSNIHQASDVKMYETHNPGFCFKRNGEHRVLQQPMPNSISFDFEYLKFLLFTNGEVDIEKVLCLHLVSTHETEHLTPPFSKHKKQEKSHKHNSPMEQLIERSKKKNAVAITSSTTLPIYVLDTRALEVINEVDDDSTLKKTDNRLVARLLINDKILGLITTVITALEYSNPEKMAVLQAKAQDADALRQILAKPHIQEFIAALKGHALVCCCSSFTLSQPFKIKPIRLNVATVSEDLGRLVSYIHSSVLQLPTKAYLKQMYENSKTPPQAVEESPRTPRSERRSLAKVQSASEGTSETTNSLEDSSRKDTAKSSKTSQLLEETSKFRHSNVNFVAKNIVDVADKENRKPYQELQRVRRESNERKRSVSLRKASMESAKRRRSSSSSSSSSPPTPSGLGRESPSRPSSPISTETTAGTSRRQSAQLQHNHGELDEEEIKVHLKQTTCLACMEKWKVPLPAPKTSKLNRTTEAFWLEDGSKEDLDLETKLKPNHERRLTNLIEQEEYKLDSYYKKYTKFNSFTGLGYTKPKTQAIKDPDEFADFDVFDLEKIKQVIREKEAQKKLQNFLVGAVPGTSTKKEAMTIKLNSNVLQ